MGNKQYVGLYAVGVDMANQPSNLLASFDNKLAEATTSTTSVHIGKLGQVGVFNPNEKTPVLFMLMNAKPGLYIGVVNVQDGCRNTNAIPLSMAHEGKLRELIIPELLQACMDNIEAVLGGGAVAGAEATPAYVSQDPS